MSFSILEGNCLDLIPFLEEKVDLTFLDPPFNQIKEYKYFNDNLSEKEYWDFIYNAVEKIFNKTSEGGSIYFMQREKNTEQVLKALRETGWTLQNLIIWKKKTSAVPCSNKFGKHYQVIAFASKGAKLRVFNKLRITPPLPPNIKLAMKTVCLLLMFGMTYVN
jgi:DNA modification methylase